MKGEFKMKVSIIIPIYRVELYIEDCLKSFMFQKCKAEIECVLVDDCSPDKSMEMVERLLESYDGSIDFKIIRHKHNRGLSAARNTGVINATGDYLYFLDSDDELGSNALLYLTECLEKYSFPDFVIGNIKVVGKPIKFKIPGSEITKGRQIFIDYTYGRWYLMACNKLIKRDFFINSNLWFAEILHEDLVFSFHLALAAQSMGCCHQPTYIYKIREAGSITSSVSLRNYEDRLKGIKLNFERICLTVKDTGDCYIHRYIINSIFNFLLKVVAEKNISSNEKRKLFSDAYMLFKTMHKYNHFGGYTILLKRMILECPLPISEKLVKLYPTL